MITKKLGNIFVGYGYNSGHCFPKDLAALARFYKKTVQDSHGAKFLEALEAKNNQLLCDAKKDLDLLTGVYGETALAKYRM